MYKIFSVEQVKCADAFTVINEPVKSIDLMERAAAKCFDWIMNRLSDSKPAFYIYCGPGNNGGDGLAIARMLHQLEFRIMVAVPGEESGYSDDFSINLQRALEFGVPVSSLEESLFWEPDVSDILIDALFGSGLSRPIEGIFISLVQSINKSDGIVVSIDIPSGLFAGLPADTAINGIVKADYTLSFEFPKLAFLMPENDEYVGEWHILPIGIHPDFTGLEPCSDFYMTQSYIQSLIKVRKKFAHKGTYGHALIIAGSYGKLGAAVLASRACLRSGAGLVTAHIPNCGNDILQTAVPEAMASLDASFGFCSDMPPLTPYSAIGIGPGLGKSEEAKKLLKLLLQEAKRPLLIDADALNILSENKTWLAFLPTGSILTPHPGEFERLAGKTANGFDRLRLLKEFCVRNKVYVILKGAYTVTCSPTGNCFFNSTGNPGMATGGSGDVLTGILTGLLAQGYPQLDACLLGVYLHGLAGDLAENDDSQEALIAGDIISQLGQAFKQLYEEKEG